MLQPLILKSFQSCFAPVIACRRTKVCEKLSFLNPYYCLLFLLSALLEKTILSECWGYSASRAFRGGEVSRQNHGWWRTLPQAVGKCHVKQWMTVIRAVSNFHHSSEWLSRQAVSSYQWVSVTLTWEKIYPTVPFDTRRYTVIPLPILKRREKNREFYELNIDTHLRPP